MNNEVMSKTFLKLCEITRDKSDREISIIGVSYIDNILKELILARFFDDTIDIKNNDSFSFKIKMCRSLGIINKNVYDTLISLNNIRNSFAHDYACNNFDEDNFSKRVDTIFRINGNIIDAIREELPRGLNVVEEYFQQTSKKLRLIICAIAGWLQGSADEIAKLDGLN